MEWHLTIGLLAVLVTYGLLFLYADVIAEGFASFGADILSIVRLFDALDEDFVDYEDEADDFKVYIVSEYFDLLPSYQFSLLKLYLANVERNDSNFMLDDYI